MNKTVSKGKHEEFIIPELDKLMETYVSRYWTRKEEKILERYYNRVDIQDLMKYLPNYSESSIRKKAGAMGLCKHEKR